ncbi:outer membrane protein [Pararhizobium sp.]|uniref:outer membrane protein n=1 Tax=Pararhizobium sp. TaxID=1977563 RepID=UPI00271A979B|nr:outer membrane protein [Pararhizobium sp.]MDO9415099.1 porin family protein [Pararhizobium sp.]
MNKFLYGVVAALFASTSAFAADLYQPVEQPPVYEAPVQQVEEASGWYLRGDAGYSFNRLRGAHYFQGSNSLVTDFSTAEIDDSFVIGGGVGYQINNYLRTDVTLDHMSADFEGSTVGGCGVALNCTSRDISSMTAWSLLANAYVDLGTYGSITPYVGAGIGGTHVKWDKLRNTSCETGNSGNCDPTIEHGGRSKWRFTYALMAGASIDVTCNIKADVGYRYRHVDGGDFFGYALSGGPGSDKGFASHEGRVGMRYAFGGCPQQAYLPPVEIPTEQPVYK